MRAKHTDLKAVCLQLQHNNVFTAISQSVPSFAGYQHVFFLHREGTCSSEPLKKSKKGGSILWYRCKGKVLKVYYMYVRYTTGTTVCADPV